MSSATAAPVRRVLARFAAQDVPAAPAAERVAWAGALIDGGDPGAATDQLVAALRAGGKVPDQVSVVVRRLTGKHAREVLAAVVDSGGLSAASYETHWKPLAAGGFAHAAAGSDEAEESLLRAVLVVRKYEDHPVALPHRNRARRIAAVLAVLAEAHRDEPERLDHWARVLGDTDRRRLAGAAALLAPLGLAEIDRRCGGLDDEVARDEAVPLAGALAAAGRATEALELAARLQPNARQEALLAVTRVVTDERDARAVVTAFRACPKGGRDRDQQMTHRHRFARVLLTFGRFDDALAELAEMRDCRISGFGPAELAWELVRWLDQRPEEATGLRLRAILDVLQSPNVIPQELAAQVARVLHRVLVLADPALRTEIINVRATAMRPRLHSGDQALVDAGLAAGLLAVGRHGEATALLRDAAWPTHRGHRLSYMARPLIEAIAAAELAERDPALFAELFGTVARRSSSEPPANPALAVRLGPTGRAAASRLLDRFPDELAGPWACRLADAAAETGDFATLDTLLEAAGDEETALTIGRRLAMALARHDEPADARTVAGACGLRLTE
jgi:hypothetical protein